MGDSFVHTIKKLQGGDFQSQALINLNGPLHSNWAGLLKIANQSAMGKQHVHLIVQTTKLEKTLEETLRDISTQVLETKYVINLRQLLRIVSWMTNVDKNLSTISRILARL
jgi:hypothetical protein